MKVVIVAIEGFELVSFTPGNEGITYCRINNKPGYSEKGTFF